MDNPETFRFNNSVKTLKEIERELYTNGSDLQELFSRLEDVSEENLELQQYAEERFSQSDVDDAFDDAEQSVMSKLDAFADDLEGIFAEHIDDECIDAEINDLLLTIKTKLQRELKQHRGAVERDINYARL